ncbi:hypothetical protein F5887DRAFT_1247388 [Amanita rubescens]|nr:hypothetical protein F5887DRAFT_1247388 [Amanita rubescens]
MANELRFGALETGNRLVLTSGAFHAAHDFTINNSTFNDVHGDFIYAQNYYEAPTTANRTPSPPLALPKHSSTLFTGRDTYLGKLREHFGLRASPNDLARRSFLLYGMGGIGKTQICLKFMEDSEDQFSHLFWIDASSEATMTSAIRQIAKEHGLQASNNAKPSVVTVMKWISSLKNDWLMVFDNANHDPDVVEKFIPPGNKGNILITSRNMSMGRVTSNKSMEVEEMNKEEAVSLLLKAGNVDVMDKESEEMAMQIVSALFYLPLAIDQAVSNDYWQLYKRNYQLLLDDSTFKGASDYGKSVYGTWEISIQEIESRAKNQSKAAQSAISLLKFIPFLHHAYFLNNTEENHTLLEALVTHIKANKAFAIKLGIKEDYYDDQFSCYAALYFQTGYWNQGEELQKEVMRMRKEKLGLNNMMTLSSMLFAALFYNRLGNWKEEELLLLDAIKIQMNTFGFEHEDTLETRAQASCIIHESGEIERSREIGHKSTYGNREKLKEAEQLLIHVIDMFKVKLGPDHPSTLYNITNLGVTYREQGRLNEAQKVLEEALETCKDRLGPSHLITLGTMRNLAMTYKAQGMLKEALDLQVIVIESMMETLGAEHSETVMSTMDLVVIYGELGKWNEAEKMLVPLIEVLKSSLGHLHPSTLRSMTHLADMYIEQEKWNEAEKLLIQVMGARKEKLGSGNPGTLTVMHNLAEVYVRKEEWSKAEELQLQIVNVGRTEMVMDHLQILASMMDLAKTYFSQKKWSSAEQLLIETMSLGKDKLEPDESSVQGLQKILQDHVVKVQREKAPNDLETIINMSNLARIYNMQGKWDQAEELLIHAVEDLNDAYTLRSMKNLAEVYQSQEKWDRSGEIMEQLLKVVKVEMGPEHPETLSIMYHLAMSYRHQGKLKEAEKLAVHVSDVLTALVGAGHPLTIENEENLEIIRKEMTKKNKGSILSKIFRHKKH